MRGAGAPLAAAAPGLLGSLGAMVVLHRSAVATLDSLLEARLMAIGRSSVLLMTSADPGALRALMRENALDGAYVVDADLRVLADATGDAPRQADLLRVDAARVARALAGEATIAPAYALDELTILTGYFPLRGAGSPRAVLALEAGDAFSQARRAPGRALATGLALAGAAAIALAAAAAAWSQSERRRREGEARAARGEAASRMAAVAAHEIRNPLAVIRGSVDLLKERAGEALDPRGREALDDVLSEVARMRRLTDDLLDLSADRPLARSRVDLAELLEDAARGAEAASGRIRVERSLASGLYVEGDPQRLRQVFANLLDNAAQAQKEGAVSVCLERDGAQARAVVRDRGPGIPPEQRGRIFEPFFTTKGQGTGLGLALARHLVERHEGELRLLDVEEGTALEVRLPLA